MDPSLLVDVVADVATLIPHEIVVGVAVRRSFGQMRPCPNYCMRNGRYSGLSSSFELFIMLRCSRRRRN